MSSFGQWKTLIDILQLDSCEHNFSYELPIEVFIFLTEPLVPYRVTVVAVNLAGPGEQEMKDFFTREGGVCLVVYVYPSTYPTYR